MDEQLERKAAKIKNMIESRESQEELQANITRSLVRDVESYDPKFGKLMRASAIPRRLDADIVGVLLGRQVEAIDCKKSLARLAEYPFIALDVDENTYHMHELTREVLIEDWQNPESRKEYEGLNYKLWEYYSESEAKPDVVEALYHRFVFDTGSALEEFMRRFDEADDFDHRAECEALLATVEEQKRELDSDQRMWLRYYRVGLSRALNHWDEAREGYRAILSEKHLPLQLRNWILHSLARIYYYTGDFSEAEVTFRKALNGWRKVQDHANERKTLNSLGLAYDGMGRWAEAEYVYELSLAICKEDNDRHLEGWILNNLGHIYHQQGLRDRAREYYESSLQVKQEIGDRRGKWWTLDNLGVLFTDQGDWDNALDRLNQAIQICKELDDPLGATRVLRNLGNCYQKQGQLDTAINYYRQAIDIQKEFKSWHLAGRTLLALAEAYSMKGNWEQAARCAKEASQVWQQKHQRMKATTDNTC